MTNHSIENTTCHTQNVIYLLSSNIKHFKDVYNGASFSVQITEVFPGVSVNHKTRLDGEDYWIEILRRSYPYGLTDRKWKVDQNLPVGCSFFSFPRSKQSSTRCKNNVNLNNLKDMDSIFDCVHN